MFILSGYLGWAAFGQLVTGRYAYFWLDKHEMKSTELIALWSTGFVFLGPIGMSSHRYATLRWSWSNSDSLWRHLRPHLPAAVLEQEGQA